MTWLRENRQYISPAAERGYTELARRRRGEQANVATSGALAGMSAAGAARWRGPVPKTIALGGLGLAGVTGVRSVRQEEALRQRQQVIRDKAAQRKAAGQLGSGRSEVGKRTLGVYHDNNNSGRLYTPSSAPYERYTAQQQRRRAEGQAALSTGAATAVGAAGTAATTAGIASHPLIRPHLERGLEGTARAHPSAESRAAARQSKKMLAWAGKHRGKLIGGGIGAGGAAYLANAYARTRRDESQGLSDVIGRTKSANRYVRAAAPQENVGKGMELSGVLLANSVGNLIHDPATRQAARNAKQWAIRHKGKLQAGAIGTGTAGLTGTGLYAARGNSRRRAELQAARAQHATVGKSYYAPVMGLSGITHGSRVN